MMIDTHSHIFDASFDEDRPQVVERALKSGVQRMILPAIDSESHDKLIKVVGDYPNECFGAMGLHPTSVNDNLDWKTELQLVEKYLREKPIDWVAVGEVGLDLYWSRDFLKEQLEAFIAQVEFSVEFDLPLIIHTRDAWDEMMEAVKPYKGRIRGVFHSFSGEKRHLDTILEMGTFYIGIGGVVTYKKSSLPGMLKNFPLEKVMLETDSPYLPPVPYRGKRNESSYLTYVAEKLSYVYEVESSYIGTVTTENAMRLFF